MSNNSSQGNRAIVYANPPSTDTEVVELPVPEPGPGEVLVRLFYSGVCHTDYSICTRGFASLPVPTPKGQIGGHEGVGEVISLGPGVQNPKVGATVGIKYLASACLNCDRCLLGGETSCPSGRISGYMTPGTFQQYCISSAIYVTPIPCGIDLVGAAPLMCGGVTVYTALKRAGIQIGHWVVISGAGGGLGHLAIQFARSLGGKVVALDVGTKENICVQSGANVFVDVTRFKEDAALSEYIHTITGGGANIVLSCSSSNRAYAQAVSFLGFRGVLSCLGLPEGKPPPIQGATVDALIALELTIMAVKTGNRLDAKECLDIAAAGNIRTHTQLRKMEELSQVFREMETGGISGRVVLDLR